MATTFYFALAIEWLCVTYGAAHAIRVLNPGYATLKEAIQSRRSGYAIAFGLSFGAGATVLMTRAYSLLPVIG